MKKLLWEDKAICYDGDQSIFFPERGEVWKINKAKQVCSNCPVKRDCLAFALGDRNLVGIWGGRTEQERRKMRKTLAMMEFAATLHAATP